MSSFNCEHCGKPCIDTPVGYVSGCEHYPVGPRRRHKLSVLRCDLVDCRGGVDGCNGSECNGQRWDKMTIDEYRRHIGLDSEETGDSVSPEC